MKAVALGVTFFIAVLIPAVAIAQPAPSTDKSIAAQSGVVRPQELRVTEYTLRPDNLVKAEALYKTRTVLYLVGLVFGIVVLWVLLKLRVAPAFRDLAEQTSKNSFVQTLVFVPCSCSLSR